LETGTGIVGYRSIKIGAVVVVAAKENLDCRRMVSFVWDTK